MADHYEVYIEVSQSLSTRSQVSTAWTTTKEKAIFRIRVSNECDNFYKQTPCKGGHFESPNNKLKSITLQEITYLLHIKLVYDNGERVYHHCAEFRFVVALSFKRQSKFHEEKKLAKVFFGYI